MPTRQTGIFYARWIVYIVVISFGVTTIWLHQHGTPFGGVPVEDILLAPLPAAGRIYNESSSAIPSVETILQSGTLPVRILVGIASRLNDNEERQRRHLNRNTYLDWDRLYRTHQSNRVCSLQEYVSDPEQFPACQLIYTFVLSPKKAIGGRDPGAELPLDLFETNRHEKDVMYINVDEHDPVGKRWGWFRYASFVMNVTSISLSAYTDCHVMIKPTIFWEENPLFFAPPPPSIKGIYAGWSNSKERCTKGKCTSLVRDTVMRRFVVLSLDLIRHVVAQSRPELTASDSPDVAIANALHSYEHSIHEVDLKGISTRASQTVGEYLERFDNYKDSLVNYTDPNETARMLSKHPLLIESSAIRVPRLLLGIFTMDSSIEWERRKMIRKTYLRAFVDTANPRRICSLNKLLQSRAPAANEECELAYAFVVGANPKGPKELVEVTNATGPLALNGDLLPSTVHLPDHDNGDIVYLNIQENMKEGKTQTFFNFATSVIEEHYFDYLGKTDTDTLVYPEALLTKVIYQLPKFPDNVRIYAGEYRVRPSTPVLQLGPAYMGGQLYVMSPDLASYVTSSACNRSALAVWSEDSSMGNFIHSHTKPIHRIWMKPPPFLHPIKRVDRLRTLWNRREEVKKTVL